MPLSRPRPDGPNGSTVVAPWCRSRAEAPRPPHEQRLGCLLAVSLSCRTRAQPCLPIPGRIRALAAALTQACGPSSPGKMSRLSPLQRSRTHTLWVRLFRNVNKVNYLQQNGGQRRGHPGYVWDANPHTSTGGPFVEAAYNKPAPAAEHFSPAREAFERMIHHLDSAASLAMNHAELEAYVIAEGREVERRLMQGHLDLRSAAERPVRAIGADGVERSQRRRSYRGLMSLVGALHVHRLVYQAVGVPFLCPQDASLNLPDDSFSLGVRRCVAEDAACGSFDEVVKRIGET